MKLRRLREGDVLDDGVTLIRGGELDPDLLRTDAMRYHGIYGSYGISVFAARGATLNEMAQHVPLVRGTTRWALMTWTRASKPWPGADTRSSPTVITTRNLNAGGRCDGPGD